MALASVSRLVAWWFEALLGTNTPEGWLIKADSLQKTPAIDIPLRLFPEYVGNDNEPQTLIYLDGGQTAQDLLRLTNKTVLFQVQARNNNQGALEIVRIDPGK